MLAMAARKARLLILVKDTLFSKPNRQLSPVGSRKPNKFSDLGAMVGALPLTRWAMSTPLGLFATGMQIVVGSLRDPDVWASELPNYRTNVDSPPFRRYERRHFRKLQGHTGGGPSLWSITHKPR